MRKRFYYILLVILPIHVSAFANGNAATVDSLVSGLEQEVVDKAMQMDTSVALTTEQLEDVKQYVAYLEALLKRKDIQFSEEAIQQSEKVKKELDKKLEELKYKVAQREEAIAQQKRKNTYLKWSIGGISLFVIPSLLAFVVGRNNRKTRKKNDSLTEKNEEIERAYASITASINYARKIQTSVLVKKEVLDTYVKESFILFQPKEVVSGDFYWFSECNGKMVVAVVDCTGHGVSGAFMTMMGISFLNEIVQEDQYTEPTAILMALRERVYESLRKNGRTTNDSMALTVLTLDKQAQTASFSGAASRMAYRTASGIQQVRFSQTAIGDQHSDVEESFVSHSISLSEVSHFYLFTNGYADQFGGESGMPFGRKRFMQLLTQQQSDAAAKHRLLQEEMNQWMQGHVQLDDMLVLGITI